MFAALALYRKNFKPVVGSPDTARRGLEALVDATGADELMLTGQIFDHAARLRSFEIFAEVHSESREDRTVPADVGAKMLE